MFGFSGVSHPPQPNFCFSFAFAIDSRRFVLERETSTMTTSGGGAECVLIDRPSMSILKKEKKGQIGSTDDYLVAEIESDRRVGGAWGWVGGRRLPLAVGEKPRGSGCQKNPERDVRIRSSSSGGGVAFRHVRRRRFGYRFLANPPTPTPPSPWLLKSRPVDRATRSTAPTACARRRR